VISRSRVDDSGFSSHRVLDGEGGFSVVRGARPVLFWGRQTDFPNDEAVGYLGDRLATGFGVEDRLIKQGARRPAARSRSSTRTFDWEPQTRR